MQIIFFPLLVVLLLLLVVVLLLVVLLLLIHLHKLSDFSNSSIQRPVGLLLGRFPVRLPMSVKVGGHSKRFATNGANMWFLTRVDRLVHFQISQYFERFIAKRTGMLTRSGVHV